MAQAFNVQLNGNEVSALDQSGNGQFDGSVTLGKPSYVPLPPPGMVTLYSDGTKLTMTDVNGNVNVVSAGGSGGGSNFGNITVTGDEVITGNIASQPAASNSSVRSVNIGGTQTFDNYRQLGDGSMAFGSGSAARDVTEGRAGTKTLYVQPNLVVGSATALGDNGVAELQLANATTIPTTNPTGGATVYASNGGLFLRDPNGTIEPLGMGNRVGAPMPNAWAETANRNTVSSSFTPVSGTLYIYSVYLQAGTVISNIGFCTGTTAASGPTHWWTVLLDNTYKLQAHSADKTSTALPASTWQSLPMVTPYTTTYTGTHYVGFMVTTSTTQPTVISNAATFNAQFITGTNVPTPLIGGTSSTGLTTPGTDGSTTYIAPTAATQTMYIYAT